VEKTTLSCYLLVGSETFEISFTFSPSRKHWKPISEKITPGKTHWPGEENGVGEYGAKREVASFKKKKKKIEERGCNYPLGTHGDKFEAHLGPSMDPAWHLSVIFRGK
jgi:hypothetical protein